LSDLGAVGWVRIGCGRGGASSGFVDGVDAEETLLGVVLRDSGGFGVGVGVGAVVVVSLLLML
jgi:hypothetical protein